MFQGILFLKLRRLYRLRSFELTGIQLDGSTESCDGDCFVA
jgi:hypothetical protein